MLRRLFRSRAPDNLRRGHAPRGKGGRGKSFKQLLLHQDYFYNHAEPHRRQPTLVTFPRFITHTATFFSLSGTPQFKTDKPRTWFREWLLKNFPKDGLWKRRGDSDGESDKDDDPWMKARGVDPADLKRFSKIAQPSFEEARSEQDNSESDTEYFLEFIHYDYPTIVARIEAHSEFFTLTLFAPPGVKEQGPRSLMPAEKEKNSDVASSNVGKGTRFSKLPEQEKTFDVARIFEDYGPWLVPAEDAPKDENPFHALYDSLMRKFPQRTFAYFKGVVVGPDAFPPPGPAFPRPSDRGAIEPSVAASTAIFLREQKELFLTKSEEGNGVRTGLFAASDEDVVACYYQHGQVICISALGAQKSAESKDELRYLLIYNDTPIKRGIFAFRPRGAHFRFSYHYTDRFRLSRLVHRVNTMGTLRLAALRDFRKLRRAGHELRQIESGLEVAAHEPVPGSRKVKLDDMIESLEKMARKYAEQGIPLFYRAARARLYFDQMKRMLDDLGIEPIPGWQSYNQFLTRRLYAQHEFISTFGDRMSALWAVARSRAEHAEVKALGWLKLATEIGSIFLLPLAFADMSRGHTNLSAHLFGFTIPEKVTKWFGGYEFQEFWLVYALIFCIWLLVIWELRYWKRWFARYFLLGLAGLVLALFVISWFGWSISRN